MVLLISINQRDIKIFKVAPTVIAAFGARYITSYLKSKNVPVTTLFLSKEFKKIENKNDIKKIKKLIDKINPDVIGLSLMSNHFPRAVYITRELRKFYKKPIVWGGIHPSIDPENCLKYADVIFRGEAEKSFYDFYKEIKAGIVEYKTPGLIYKKNEKTVNNGIYPIESNLDNLPFPDYNLKTQYTIYKGKLRQFDDELYKKFYAGYSGKYRILTTRGCPHSCTYCCNSFLNKIYNHKFLRFRNVENVIQELIEYIKKFPYTKYIMFQDDCFTINTIEWFKEFHRKYKEKINLPFYCQTSPPVMTEEKLALLIDAGLNFIQIGLESGSDRTNFKIYKRFTTNKQFLEGLEKFEKYRPKLKMDFDVLVDNPYETEEDIIQTIQTLNQIKRPYNIGVFSISFYPKTELYERVIKDGIISKNETKFINKNFHHLKGYYSQILRLMPNLKSNKVDWLVTGKKSLPKKVYIAMYYFYYKKLLVYKRELRNFIKNILKTPYQTKI